MAASATMQLIFNTQALNGTRPSLAALSRPMQRVQRSNVQRTVRCMSSEKGNEGKTSPATPPPLPPQVKPTLPPKAAPTPAPRMSTKFSDVFAFSGPAPERINGRLAMLGFVAAMAVEVSSGQDVFQQIGNGGVPLFLGASILLSVASVIPLFQGVSANSKSGQLMSSDAELLNGRFAMLGLVALALTEYVKGGALV